MKLAWVISLTAYLYSSVEECVYQCGFWMVLRSWIGDLDPQKGLPVSSCVTLREGMLVSAAFPWGPSGRWGVRTFWIQMKDKFTSQSSKWGRQGSQLWKSVSGVYETDILRGAGSSVQT